MKHPFASLARRTVATVINLALGGWLMIMPRQLCNSPEPGLALLRNPVFDHLLSIILMVILLLFVYFMQGSLGFVFVGLRVEDMKGERPRFSAILLRSLPYLLIFLLCKVLPFWSKMEYSVALLLAVLFVLSLLFVVISGCVVVWGGKRSLLDMISATRVVRVYSVNPRDDGQN